MGELVPAALVLGCNNPVGLNPLSDWIEEQTGVAPDFVDTGWSDRSNRSSSDGAGIGYGHFNGNGHGQGIGYGNDHGGGFGDGYGYATGSGTGYGDGIGHSYGNSLADGGGYSSCYGYE